MAQSNESRPRLEHAQALLDVVFGVVIAIPLINLPEKVLAVVRDPSFGGACTILLTVSALIFCTFYWIEAGRFITEQDRFDARLRTIPDTPARTPVPLAGVILSGLLTLLLATATLAFSSETTLRPFYVANILFWTEEVLGSVGLHHLYRPFASAAEHLRKTSWNEHRWYWGHIASRYLLAYGLLNGVFFGGLLLIDVLTHGSQLARLISAGLVLAMTVFRHAHWRNTLYERWLVANHSP